MSLGILNNISAVYAEQNLNTTQASLQNTLEQLSSGSRINSGADDAAGLSVADGLKASEAALSQSSSNAQSGVGLLQVADGALSQVTSLLNRAVTLATEASNGTLNSSQTSAANSEYQDILGEITTIGSTTNFNGNAVFSATATDIYTSDGTSSGSKTYAIATGALSDASVGLTSAGAAGQDLSATDLSTAADAQTALGNIYTAVQNVAQQRGDVGANINTLNAASNVVQTENDNLTSAENTVDATDYGAATSNLSKYQILSQTGIAALAQANSTQQEVLKLIQ